jgi:hypothetical protein
MIYLPLGWLVTVDILRFFILRFLVRTVTFITAFSAAATVLRLHPGRHCGVVTRTVLYGTAVYALPVTHTALPTVPVNAGSFTTVRG